jgi:hypothetical protein
LKEEKTGQLLYYFYFCLMTGHLVKPYFLFLVIGFFSLPACAQKDFGGSFMMSFKYTPERSKASDSLLWNIDNGKMVLEIQDEMKKKGVSKRVLFNPSDSTWTMGMEFSKVKQATRIHAASLFSDSSEHKKITVKTTGHKSPVSGFNCHEVLIESDEYKSVLWIADDLNFNLSRLYKMLAHCGMMGDLVGKGDWFLWKPKKGMVLQANVTKKLTGESYTMTISGLTNAITNPSLFSLTGYRISDIPEGQHCGPITDGK